MARLPVPEGDGAVVAAGEEDVVLVDAQGVDDGVVAVEVLHEGAFGAFPLLDAAGAAAGKGPLGRVEGEGSDALFVMGQDAHGLAGRQVPESDGRVERRGDDLRFDCFALEVRDGLPVAAEYVDVASGPHIPNSCDAISASRD